MRIGDKVVCVDASRNEMLDEPPPLIEGLVYVVSQAGRWMLTNEDYINLIGVKHPHVGWRARRFRKLDELKEQNATKQRQAQVA